MPVLVFTVAQSLGACGVPLLVGAALGWDGWEERQGGDPARAALGNRAGGMFYSQG